MTLDIHTCVWSRINSSGIFKRTFMVCPYVGPYKMYGWDCGWGQFWWQPQIFFPNLEISLQITSGHMFRELNAANPTVLAPLVPENREM